MIGHVNDGYARIDVEYGGARLGDKGRASRRVTHIVLRHKSKDDYADIEVHGTGKGLPLYSWIPAKNADEVASCLSSILVNGVDLSDEKVRLMAERDKFRVERDRLRRDRDELTKERDELLVERDRSRTAERQAIEDLAQLKKTLRKLGKA